MTLKSIGVLGNDVISALKAAKLAIIPRNGEVWIDDVDIPAADRIISEMKSKKPLYSFNIHGVIISSEVQITVYNNAGSSVDPMAGPGVSVFIYSRPKTDSYDPPKILKKIKIGSEEITLDAPCYTPAYRGVCIADDSGFVLFEVLPYNVFVLWNTTKCPEQTKIVFENLLRYALVMANHNDNQSKTLYDELFKKQKPKRDEVALRAFEKVFESGVANEIKNCESNINIHKNSINEAHNVIFNAHSAILELEKKLDYLKECKKSVSLRAREEFEKIRNLEKHGKVQNIEIRGDHLKFETSMIYFRESPDSEPIELGRYLCEINFRDSFKIKITNLTKKLEYDGYRWEHPHVNSDRICMGNMTSHMPEFAARRDFEALIMCTLKWLQNVDTKDAWGRNIKYWKEYQEKNNKKKLEVKNV